MLKRSLSLVTLAMAACAPASTADLAGLKTPPGFRIELFAETGSTPRLMAFSPGGVLLVTATSDGKVLALPDPQKSGRAQRVVTVLNDLDAPHGIAFHKGALHVAEGGRIVRYDWDEAKLRATNPRAIAQVPRGGGHFTRTILFHGGKMYVSVGSTCNVCEEKDPRRAAVLEFDEDGSGERLFARGTRNAVGLAVSPQTGTVWATDNGRDWLGDNVPPEEVNDLGKGGDFGWPYCYGKRIADLEYSRDAARRCPSTILPKVEMQAHSAPLGLAFYTSTAFPAEYRGDLFVAFHGSWNRSVPTGYKVVRVKLDAAGNSQGVEDFVSGWVRPDETRKGVWTGRPVDVMVAPDGSLYISDDSRESKGAIYRVTWAGK
ncbi:MAG: PQQ-dependent sugar dehydrogenase [Acidobacteria bacterium]|nr:PQQ-dependent sugar dehydrogenase [Acidobacteriota bacterium]